MRNPITKLAASAVVIAGTIVALSQIGSSTPAFARVIENIVAAESISFLSKQKLGIGPAITFKMYLRGKMMRGDMVQMEGDQDGLAQLQEELQRRNIPAIMSYVSDFERKKGVQLDHFRKTYKGIDIDERMAKEFARANLIEQFHSVRHQDAEKLREELQDGRKIDVYLVKHVELMGIKAELSGQEGERMTVWVDRLSSLPVRIFLEFSAHSEGKSQDWLDFSEFIWNEQLDPKLFSLEAPADYTLAEANGM